MRSHEFTVIQDLYDQIGEEMVLIKKDMKIKWLCRDLDSISSIQQAYNEKGNIRMHHTKIFTSTDEVIVRMPYNKVKELIGLSNKKIGFKTK